MHSPHQHRICCLAGHFTHENDATATDLATNLTRGIVEMLRTQSYAQNKDTYFLQGRICPEDEAANPGDEERLKVGHLSGLFILTMATLAIALSGAVVERVLVGRQMKDLDGGGGSVTEVDASPASIARSL